MATTVHGYRKEKPQLFPTLETDSDDSEAHGTVTLGRNMSFSLWSMSRVGS